MAMDKENFHTFSEAMTKASLGICDSHYFQLPVAGRENPIFRERVYCYEFYHQMRNTLGDAYPFKFDGEVDKRLHPRIPGEKKPDFIVHIPGEMERNFVVIEVKPVSVTDKDLEHDLKKLQLFLDEGNYHWAVMLVYGNGEYQLPERIKSKVTSYSKVCGNRILLAWHSGLGQKLEIT